MGFGGGTAGGEKNVFRVCPENTSQASSEHPSSASAGNTQKHPRTRDVGLITGCVRRQPPRPPPRRKLDFGGLTFKAI